LAISKWVLIASLIAGLSGAATTRALSIQRDAEQDALIQRGWIEWFWQQESMMENLGLGTRRRHA
jgi:hypothetical protein